LFGPGSFAFEAPSYNFLAKVKRGEKQHCREKIVKLKRATQKTNKKSDDFVALIKPYSQMKRTVLDPFLYTFCYKKILIMGLLSSLAYLARTEYLLC
jgi:hypothetical protein